MTTELVKLPKPHHMDYQITVRNNEGGTMVHSQLRGTKREAEQELKAILLELKTK